MVGKSSVMAILSILFLVSGCSPYMVRVNEIDGSHTVDRSLTKDQVRDAIHDGAKAAGWRAKDLGESSILASYTYSQHTVHLKIDYSDSLYTTRYYSSSQMKMFCTPQAKTKHRNMKLSGRDSCPGDQPPAYIHRAYKQWTDSLNKAIQFSLDTI